MTDKAETFEDFIEQNPRLCIPNDRMEKFLEFAKNEYKDYEVVNCCHCEDDYDECMEEVERYVYDSMEAILLFEKYIKQNK